MSVSLPQHDDDTTARANQLAESRQTYRYAYDWPVGVATAVELPEADHYPLSYIAHSAGVYAKIAANLAAMAVEGVEHGALVKMIGERIATGIHPREFAKNVLSTPAELAKLLPHRFPPSVEAYEAFFAMWDAPPVVDFYHRTPADLSDAFAWQRVGGVNPMVLARCAAVPAHFPVTDAHLQATLGSDDSLAAAAAEHRLYLADYAALDGVATGVTDGLKKYMSAPLALFAVERGTGTLRAIAIQAEQVPSPKNPVVTPADGWAWRTAMTLVQVADASHHEGVAHLSRTHMVMEAVKLAMERQLAARHPLYKLLEAHLEVTLAINHSAKTSLIAPDGTVDHCFAPTIEAFSEIVKGAISTYSITDAIPRVDFAARGLDNTEALPTHPYRDDSLPIWDALSRFLTGYVDVYYEDDAAVGADTELAAFVRELGADDGGRLHDVPEVHTRHDLAELLTRIVFIAGPGHSAVNFPQFPFMGFVSNMPGATYKPVDGASWPADDASLAAILPPYRTTLEAVTMVYFLSNCRTSKLGHYGPLHFLNRQVRKLVDAFQDELEAIEADIVVRDATRLMPYPYLRPSQVLQSISI
ncbi:MAG: lipoxygenase family protein [Sandaracinaceae bacterium]